MLCHTSLERGHRSRRSLPCHGYISLSQRCLKAIQHSGKTTDEIAVIEENIRTAAGSRHHNIRLRPGTGALFLLLQISEKMQADFHFAWKNLPNLLLSTLGG